MPAVWASSPHVGITEPKRQAIQSPPIISCHNLDPVPAITALIQKQIAVLERISDRITGCKVTLEAAQKRKLRGEKGLYAAAVTVVQKG